MAKKIGVLVELDYCVGCSACQLACQDYYQLPVTETYMRCFLGKTDVVEDVYKRQPSSRGCSATSTIWPALPWPWAPFPAP